MVCPEPHLCAGGILRRDECPVLTRSGDTGPGLTATGGSDCALGTDVPIPAHPGRCAGPVTGARGRFGAQMGFWAQRAEEA